MRDPLNTLKGDPLTPVGHKVAMVIGRKLPQSPPRTGEVLNQITQEI
jgi:hypothetical protein